MRARERVRRENGEREKEGGADRGGAMSEIMDVPVDIGKSVIIVRVKGIEWRRTSSASGLQTLDCKSRKRERKIIESVSFVSLWDGLPAHQ
jgi:hypothetical protein